MLRSMSPAVFVCSALTGLCVASPTDAQQYAGSPVCQCAQPVLQTCYRTVPVTEYRQVRQTVRRPVVETRYEQREVTAYRPVVETRTAQVPTVTYEDVTEYRTVCRDYGRWVTEYRNIPKIHPCRYDNRPNFFGWLNRTAFSLRQAVTPDYIARRRYAPNVVAQEVPITRRIPKYGTKTVTYKVTRMEPYKTTRRVPVQTVRYVEKEVVRNVPTTVMRRVPIGTSLAWSYSPATPSPRTALGPTPDPISAARSDAASSGRTADQRNDRYDGRQQNEPESASPSNGRTEKNDRPESTSHGSPEGAFGSRQAVRRAARPPVKSEVAARRSPVPTAVRVGRWTAHRSSITAAAKGSAGPSLISPSLSVADSRR